MQNFAAEQQAVLTGEPLLGRGAGGAEWGNATRNKLCWVDFHSGDTLPWYLGLLQSWQLHNFIDKTCISMAFCIPFITLERHIYDEFKLSHLHAYFYNQMQILSHYFLCVKFSSFSIFSSHTSFTIGLLQKIPKHYTQRVLSNAEATDHLLQECKLPRQKIF